MKEKYKILIVDDADINRSILSDMLSAQYEIIEAGNGLEAISILDKQYSEISLILLDIMMPKMDGFEVLSIMNKSRYLKSIPIITISAETSSAYINKAYNLGAIDYINRPFDENTIIHRVKNTIMLYTKQKIMEDTIAEQFLEKEQKTFLMIEILANIVEFGNSGSSMHILNIRTLTELLLRHLIQMTDQYSLDSVQISLIANASCMHDIGKISISQEILNKPKCLTTEEFEIIKNHTIIGAQILEKVPEYKKDGLLQIAHDICRWHHERYDGGGYPDGLKGEEIPISAQIVALADVYDALTNERIYKPTYSSENAVQMILNGECGVFSPLLLQCLKEVAPFIEIEKEKNAVLLPTSIDINNILIEKQNFSKPSKRTMTLLEQERIKFQFFASMAKEIMFEYNEDSDLLTISDWGVVRLGLDEITVHPLNNEKLRSVFKLKDLKDLADRLRQASVNHPVIHATYNLNVQGQWRWHKIIARPLWSNSEDDERTGSIGKIMDIHEEYTQMEILKMKVEQDSLTKLYNHVSIRKLIEAELKLKNKKHYALVIIDLDYFKIANDKYGHMFGDKVLKEVAKRILKNIKEEDIASRIGGDEFLIFFSYNENSNIEVLVKQLFQNICGKFEEFTISICMGVSIYPENGRNYELLFQQADKALYNAKKRGRQQYCFYSTFMQKNSSVISSIDSNLDIYSQR